MSKTSPVPEYQPQNAPKLVATEDSKDGYDQEANELEKAKNKTAGEKFEEIARILAYNVVNYSFFLDPHDLKDGEGDKEKTWFIGEHAIDDESVDIVE